MRKSLSLFLFIIIAFIGVCAHLDKPKQKVFDVESKLKDFEAAIASRDVSRNAVGSVDAISGDFFEFKREIGKYFIGQNVKANSILPKPEFFKSSIDIFSFHDWFISWIMIFFNKMK